MMWYFALNISTLAYCCFLSKILEDWDRTILKLLVYVSICSFSGEKPFAWPEHGTSENSIPTEKITQQ